jgi:RND family efflux transporter MFP subunit
MTDHATKPPFFSGRLLMVVILIAGVFAALLMLGLWPRRERVAAITEEVRDLQSGIPQVTVAQAVMAPPSRELVLPGTVAAILETPIYARAEGYLKSVRADIGDIVKKDQILAELDTPELDQSLNQARARLDQLRASEKQSRAMEQQALANLELAEITLGRVEELVAEGVLSKQDGDDRRAQRHVRQAEVESAKATIEVALQNIRAQEAEVARLEQLASFKLVRAPYDGVITVRNCATGNLITPSAVAQGRELYRIANNDILRVFVGLPQMNLADVRVGQDAEVTVVGQAGLRFRGKLARTANSLEESTRTQRTEIRVENRNNALLPGMYIQAKFLGVQPKTTVLIPGDTLLTRSDGSYVAILDDASRVRFAKLDLGRDLGSQVEVLAGLRGGESLIVSPSDAVVEGALVKGIPRK